MSKEARSPNARLWQRGQAFPFGIRALEFFRHSDFVIRHLRGKIALELFSE
jgi:hypothetical protein